MILVPKEEFLKTEAAKRFNEICHTDWFKQVLCYAIAEFEYNMHTGESVFDTAACASRSLGARRFANLLLNLTEQPVKSSVFNVKTLNYGSQ